MLGPLAMRRWGGLAPEQPGVWANSHTWVVPVHEDADPTRYRAAMEYAKFMFEHNGDWARGSGHLSVRPSVLESGDYESARSGRPMSRRPRTPRWPCASG